MVDPFNDPDSRYYGETMEEIDAKLAAEGWATGMDVMEQVAKAYANYLGDDGELAAAQLASLVNAILNADPPA